MTDHTAQSLVLLEDFIELGVASRRHPTAERYRPLVQQFLSQSVRAAARAGSGLRAHPPTRALRPQGHILISSIMEGVTGGARVHWIMNADEDKSGSGSYAKLVESLALQFPQQLIEVIKGVVSTYPPEVRARGLPTAWGREPLPHAASRCPGLLREGAPRVSRGHAQVHHGFGAILRGWGEEGPSKRGAGVGGDAGRLWDPYAPQQVACRARRARGACSRRLHVGRGHVAGGKAAGETSRARGLLVLPCPPPPLAPMRLLKRSLNGKNGEGAVTLMAEEPEDMWHIFNLVAKGDTVRSTTMRKVRRFRRAGAAHAAGVDSDRGLARLRRRWCVRRRQAPRPPARSPSP